MKHLVLGVLAMAMVAAAANPPVAPQYFRYERSVNVGGSDGQKYIVVDEAMWQQMRRDLGDMRLYSGTAEVPYAMHVQRGGRSLQQNEAKLLDLGDSNGVTGFKLQPSVSEYDTITLDLKTKNFVTQADVEGSDDGSQWTRMSTATIFDFSDEKLGTNLEIKLPSSSHFQLLRIRIPSGVAPKDVVGATIATLKDRGASWVSIPAQIKTSQSGRDTVLEWDASPIPLERVQLAIGDHAVNFHRPAELFDADGHLLASGNFTRVHMRRNGRLIDREELALDLPYATESKKFKLVIHNGDDPPLPIQSVQPLSYERRVYFEPRGRQDLTLYFADEKVEPPVYDYAQFFQESPEATRAELGPARTNAVYQSRPDDRPWTERNKWVLWTALIAAVLGLGAVAVRGIVKTPA